MFIESQNRWFSVREGVPGSVTLLHDAVSSGGLGSENYLTRPPEELAQLLLLKESARSDETGLLADSDL